MSEYQYVGFRAIDRPVGAKDLEYMERQSSRAEITPWSFDNEYHYGDFRGDAEEMLRRGYDIHLHYANFGICKLLIRLPHGLPDPEAAKPYLADDEPRFIKDKRGTGGILAIEPFHESGDLEQLWEVDSMLDRLVALRAEILDGDLRPLYLAHLAVACDNDHEREKTVEAPVPAGLASLTEAQQALAELYGLAGELIAAAAQEAPAMPARSRSSPDYSQWLRDQPEAAKDVWLAAWIADATSPIRAEILAKFRTDCQAPAWPTARAGRTIAQLETAAAKIAAEAKQRAAAEAARLKARRLAQMAADPAATCAEIKKLVANRSTNDYRRAAERLSELREALAESDQSSLAEKSAQKLKAANPTLNILKSELRRHGFASK